MKGTKPYRVDLLLTVGLRSPPTIHGQIYHLDDGLDPVCERRCLYEKSFGPFTRARREPNDEEEVADSAEDYQDKEVSYTFVGSDHEDQTHLAK
jgi:hypothetical protein